ncbi:GAF domain-containing protein [Paenibacillus dendritiformis]|uniref:GAF domain-containing protein n=1 Tax=Paenibacillus dendritiformis C454 TaxID=1131935 RepID=H3SK14_9BACL|nr:GAF domain-containing protein [Paenibacillus dendritiformis]EHQ60550.1 GAF domain-containing protein [Paenibacillus dendritiformis C454]CAH8768252.1 GAF domain-containing protein [Paenibacillus dendritiformis]
MFTPSQYSGQPDQDYPLLHKQLLALIEGEPNLIANLANASALLWQGLKEINWAGFYLMDESKEELVLGPFQGLPACIRIPLGRGVCGAAAREQRTLVVPDVHAFPGHIACDAASRSEIVVPMMKEGRLVGVLDIDSPVTDRFQEPDREALEKMVEALMREAIL